MEEDSQIEEMVLFPEGTEIYPPDENNEVAIKFATQEDAIIYYEFLKSFTFNQITLECRGTV